MAAAPLQASSLPHALTPAARGRDAAWPQKRALGALLAPHLQGAALQGQRGPEADDTGPDEEHPGAGAESALASMPQTPLRTSPKQSFLAWQTILSPELPCAEFRLQRLM